MGTVYLVGAGPGDPGLITLKGLELLKTCDAVIYDRLASYRLLEHLRSDCVKIYVGKAAGHHSKSQEEINRLLVECAVSYGKVVRLKGGDPFVFGRGGEEIEELQKYGIRYEVIPGVTSAAAVPESAGIPLTHRGMSRSFHVITGHTMASGDTLTDHYELLAKLDGTLVFLMGLSSIGQITERLIEYGKDVGTPAAVISNGTMRGGRTVRGTLRDIASKVKEEGIVSPAVIVIGDTAALQLADTARKPLSGIQIGITGTVSMREKLEQGLQELGAEAYPVCDMRVVETPFLSTLEEEIKAIGSYRWIIFTSRNAIKIFFDRMESCGIDRRCLGKVRFAVIGSGTGQALRQYGYFADFIPDSYTTDGLAKEFVREVSPEDRILIPRALRGSEELTRTFREKGLQYKEIPVYDVKGTLTENTELLPETDCLVFASASGADAFFEGIKNAGLKLPEEIKIACIGEITADTVKRYHHKADIIAEVSDTDGLISGIRRFNWKK